MSSGYILYSLDAARFHQLVEQPTAGQLSALGTLLSDGLAELEGEFQEGDPILAWKTDVDSLARIAAQRLPRSDWYGDLSVTGKTLWEGVVFNACMDCKSLDVGFRVENDGIYWDVVELAQKKLGGPRTPTAFSGFGTRPYRYLPSPQSKASLPDEDRRSSLRALGDFLKGVRQSPERLLEKLTRQEGIAQQHKSALAALLSNEEVDADDASEAWDPMHSMHSPEEVRAMLGELKTVELAMKATKKGDVRRQYEEDLLPALETIAKDGRMLFVQVDT